MVGLAAAEAVRMLLPVTRVVYTPVSLFPIIS